MFTIGAVGDVLPHDTPIRVADTGGDDYDFTPMLEATRAWSEGVDLALCNMEVPLSMPGETPSGYPLFGAPKQIVGNLAALGWDGCATATNHAIDRGADNARSHSNGQVPSAELCPLPVSGHLLHPDAAHGWWQLNRAFARRFSSGICVTDSYRSFEAQSAVYGAKPGLAAVPGTSNHGWGVAMDLCGGVESYASPQHVWLAEHGAKYGWVNPSWATAGGSRPEPWHWEYVGR